MPLRSEAGIVFAWKLDRTYKFGLSNLSVALVGLAKLPKKCPVLLISQWMSNWK
jgi:hypothetical protein